MPATPKFTLAIETATQKGSVNLLENGREIAFWVGDGSKSVSSELLPQISKLLADGGITINEVDLLAVSAGPGSFTGVRIGLAAAQGLQMAAGINAAAVPLTEAIAWSAGTSANGLSVICLIPSGRGEAYWQEFNGHQAVTEIISSKIEEIAEVLSTKDVYCAAAPGLKPEYIKQLESRAGKKVNITGDNLAKSIGEVAIYRQETGEGFSGGALSAMYVKGFNAGRG